MKAGSWFALLAVLATASSRTTTRQRQSASTLQLVWRTPSKGQQKTTHLNATNPILDKLKGAFQDWSQVPEYKRKQAFAKVKQEKLAKERMPLFLKRLHAEAT